jgi:hypothetical protein
MKKDEKCWICKRTEEETEEDFMSPNVDYDELKKEHDEGNGVVIVCRVCTYLLYQVFLIQHSKGFIDLLSDMHNIVGIDKLNIITKVSKK